MSALLGSPRELLGSPLELLGSPQELLATIRQLAPLKWLVNRFNRHSRATSSQLYSANTFVDLSIPQTLEAFLPSRRRSDLVKPRSFPQSLFWRHRLCTAPGSIAGTLEAQSVGNWQKSCATLRLAHSITQKRETQKQAHAQFFTSHDIFTPATCG